MMTKDEILQEAKALHYTEKLAIAQSLIQLSRKELEQLTSRFSHVLRGKTTKAKRRCILSGHQTVPVRRRQTN